LPPTAAARLHRLSLTLSSLLLFMSTREENKFFLKIVIDLLILILYAKLLILLLITINLSNKKSKNLTGILHASGDIP
jgi:hypothetical protein